MHYITVLKSLLCFVMQKQLVEKFCFAGKRSSCSYAPLCTLNLNICMCYTFSRSALFGFFTCPFSSGDVGERGKVCAILPPITELISSGAETWQEVVVNARLLFWQAGSTDTQVFNLKFLFSLLIFHVLIKIWIWMACERCSSPFPCLPPPFLLPLLRVPEKHNTTALNEWLEKIRA